jgi:hypothetical protein
VSAVLPEIEYCALRTNAFAEHEAFVNRRHLVCLSAIKRGRRTSGSGGSDDRPSLRSFRERRNRLHLGFNHYRVIHAEVVDIRQMQDSIRT